MNKINLRQLGLNDKWAAEAAFYTGLYTGRILSQERYLSVGRDSGAVPVVVLTKSDLCDHADQRLHETASAAIGADILVTSAMHEDGYRQIKGYMKEGHTAAW